jgi:hypothetical protein
VNCRYTSGNYRAERDTGGEWLKKRDEKLREEWN